MRMTMMTMLMLMMMMMMMMMMTMMMMSAAIGTAGGAAIENTPVVGDRYCDAERKLGETGTAGATIETGTAGVAIESAPVVGDRDCGAH
jgi:hypothetical protein